MAHRAAAAAAATAALITILASCGTGTTDAAFEQPAATTSGAATPAPPSIEPEDDAHGLACLLRDMNVSVGPDRSGGRPGERSMSLRFTNVGEKACTLKGRPSVEFFDSGGRSVLRADSNGGGRQNVQGTGRTAIRLKPGASAEVVLAKSRCDLDTGAVATQVKIGLPTAGEGVTLVTDPPDIVSGFSRCRGGDQHPGQTFAISDYTPFKCRVVGNATGGGWCEGDLDRPFTQTVEESERAAEKEELARKGEA